MPPRRRKRNVAPTKPVVAPRTIKEEHKSAVRAAASRPERKPRSLPPPPPIPRSAARERKPRAPNHSAPTVPNNSNSDQLDTRNVSSTAKPLSENLGDPKKNPRFIVTNVTVVDDKSESLKLDDKDISNRCSDANLHCRNDNRSGRSSPMPTSRSPLFFTLQDFESVMAHSGTSDRSVNEQYESIVTEDTSGPASVSSFVGDFLADEADQDEEEEVCFRVTTTNVPFEKSLGGWSLSIDGTNFVGNRDGTDNYIFEDYIDRSRRVNARTAFFFDDDTFESFVRDDAAGTKRRSATKVRFVIESPSSSTPDPELDDTCDDLGNIETLIVDDEGFDDNHRSSVIITEIIDTDQTTDNDNTERPPIPDEFGEIPFSSLLDSDSVSHQNINEPLNSSIVEINADDTALSAEPSIQSASTESKAPKNQHTPRNSPSPRFMQRDNLEAHRIPKIEDELLEPELPVTYDPREEGFVRKTPDLSRFESDGRKSAREAFVTRHFSAISCENRNSDLVMFDDTSEEGTTVRKPRTEEKKKIFIDAALRDFIANDDDMDWNDLSDEDEENDDSNFAAGSSFSSVNDRRAEEPAADFSDVLNRDTRDRDVAFIDKHPRSEPSPTSDKETDENRFANKEDPKDGLAPSSASSGHCLINTSALTTGSKGDTNWLPVSARRNSFLENMLVDDDSVRGSRVNVPCSIIAAHPKQPVDREPIVIADAQIQGAHESRTSLFRDVDKSTDVVEATVRRGSNGSSLKQLRNETGVRIVGVSPEASRERGASGVEKETRSAGEAKSDVLSELLCNFGAIKLKPVEPQKRDSYLPESDDGAVIERKIGNEEAGDETEKGARIRSESVLGVASSGDEEKKTNGMALEFPYSGTVAATAGTTKTTTALRSSDIEVTTLTSRANRGWEKTDDRRFDDESAKFVVSCTMNEDKSCRDEQNAQTIDSNASVEVSTDNDAATSVDKCAIDRKINPLNRCNNNDNNAMTPVDISNDQKSCDADVTIAPGSVRSFVELYEIRGEQTSKHSKSNYSLPVAEKLTSARFGGGLRNDDDRDDGGSEVLGDEIVERSKGATGIRTERSNRGQSEINVRGSWVDLRGSSGEDAGHNAIVRNIVRQSGETCQGGNGFSSTNDSSYVQQRQTPGKAPVAAKRRSPDSCLKISAELSPRGEPKKTVTFNSDCEVIKTQDNAPDERPPGEPTNGERGARLKTKKRAPGKPAAAGEACKRDCATVSTVEFNQGINPTAERLLKQEDRPSHATRSEVNPHRDQVRGSAEFG